MDPTEQLQQLYLAGFEFQTFDRFPKCVGVIWDNCVVLFVPTPDGLQMLGSPGWRMGEVLGFLTEVSGRKVFQVKEQIIDATPERLQIIRHFQTDIKRLIHSVNAKN